MKSLLSFFAALLFVSGIASQKPDLVKPVPVNVDEKPSEAAKEKKKKIKITKESVDEKLEVYFSGREILPYIIVNNIDDEQKDIEIANHKIKWINSEAGTEIKINDDLFSLNGKFTFNNVWDDEPDEVNFGNSWTQIRFYKINNREIIAITIRNYPCNGLGCGVEYYLVYDLKTKKKNFFGVFSSGRGSNLYDFAGDGTIDFLSTDYIGGRLGSKGKIQNIHNLYTLNDDGDFILQKDKNQNPFFIKRVFQAEDGKEIDRKFEQHWIEEIR